MPINYKDIPNLENVQIDNIKVNKEPANVKKYEISFYEKEYKLKTLPYDSMGPYTILPQNHYYKEKEVIGKLKMYNFTPKIVNFDDNEHKLYLSDCGKLLTSENVPDNWKQQLTDILNVLKKESIYHNDMHPCNFSVKDGKIYLLDFGCASYDKPEFPSFNMTQNMINKSINIMDLFNNIVNNCVQIHTQHMVNFNNWINNVVRKQIK